MTTATIRRIAPPAPESFGVEDFLPDPSLDALYQQLIYDYPDTHGHLETASVKLLWKAKGGKSQGKQRLGYCAKTSGLARFFAEADFVIWLAADTVREREMSPAQIRAAVSHEMRHIAWEDGEDGADGKFVIAGHDAELFLSEIRDLGNWLDVMREAASAFEQAPLFED